MKILKSNFFRSIAVITIVFLSVPFLFPEERVVTSVEYEDGGSEPVVISQNPLARFFDRVASFYGKKGGKTKNTMVRGTDHDALLNSIAMADRNGFDPKDAALRTHKGTPSERGNLEDTYETASASNSIAYRDINGNIQGRARRAAEPVQEFIRMDGKTYEVKTDAAGEKFVTIEGKHISFDKLMASTISKEEFESGKKLAPHLTDSELIYAINYPGGVRAYLKSPDYGMYSHSGSPSMFGGPSGPGTGGGLRASANFGGGGLAASGGDEIFDGRHGALSSKFNKVRRDMASSSDAANAGNVVNNQRQTQQQQVQQQQQEQQNQQLVALQALLPHQFIGSKPQGIALDNRRGGNRYEGEPRRTSAYGGAAAGTVAGGAETPKEGKHNAHASNVTRIPLAPSDENITPTNNTTRKAMTDELLGGKEFVGVIRKKGEADPQTVPNAWILPSRILADNPGVTFFDSNRATFSRMGGIEETKWDTVDSNFVSYKKSISESTIDIPKINAVMIDGLDQRGDRLTSVPNNTYYYQVLNGLLNNRAVDASQNGFVNLSEIKKDTTLLVVPNVATKKALEQQGYNVALFNQYAVTPNNLESFFNETNAAVGNIANNIRNPQPDSNLAQAQPQREEKVDELRTSFGKKIKI